MPYLASSFRHVISSVGLFAGLIKTTSNLYWHCFWSLITQNNNFAAGVFFHICHLFFTCCIEQGLFQATSSGSWFAGLMKSTANLYWHYFWCAQNNKFCNRNEFHSCHLSTLCCIEQRLFSSYFRWWSDCWINDICNQPILIILLICPYIH